MNWTRTFAASSPDVTPVIVGRKQELAAVSFNANYDGAGVCSFAVCQDGVTYQQLVDGFGAAITVAAAPGVTIALDAATRAALNPWRFIQILSGTIAAPVNQSVPIASTLTQGNVVPDDNQIDYVAVTAGDAGNDIEIGVEFPTPPASAFLDYFDDPSRAVSENYGIEYVSQVPGPTGNGYSVQYVDPGPAVRAVGSFAGTGPLQPFDTITIGTETYRLVNVMAAPGDVQNYPLSLSDTLTGLRKVINGTGISGTDYFAGTTTPHPDVTAINTATNLIVSAIAYGAGGNLIGTSYTPSGGPAGAWPFATLQNGFMQTTEGVAVNFGTDVEVTLRRDEFNNYSTAAQVIAIVNGTPAAFALVDAQDYLSSTGAGQVMQAATYDFGSPAANNSVRLTAVDKGVVGNGIDCEIVDPGMAGALSVNTVGLSIVVTLAHDGANPTSTATDVINAMIADGPTAALVTASSAGGTGLGLVVPEGPVNLDEGDGLVTLEPLAGGGADIPAEIVTVDPVTLECICISRNVAGVTSTANEVIAAFTGDPAASALFTAASGGGTGTGLAEQRVPSDPMTGGSDNVVTVSPVTARV